MSNHDSQIINTPNVPPVEGHMNASSASGATPAEAQVGELTKELESFFDSPAKLLFQNVGGSKRSAGVAGVSEYDPKKTKGDPVKKFKMEPGSTSGSGQGITIVLSLDPVSPGKVFHSTNYNMPIKKEPGSLTRHGSGITIDISSDRSSSPGHLVDLSHLVKKEVKPEPSKSSSISSFVGKNLGSSQHENSNMDTEDRAHAHAAELERFLVYCNVPKDDETTRLILQRANVHSWTDLIPGIQMTESTLTTRGMHPCLASHLLSEAMDRMNGLKDDINDLPDEDSDGDEDHHQLEGKDQLDTAISPEF
ncbi:uncharacterized protein MELLADRAFT_105651 [Melampsora larici-populina 98AG31]|uniref:Uncharacterized protein n=1 Tax=Melampsora larici-populina (strain 98AG31 / pathotype 3-4-7) TaxID=747676 RepID=F4RIX3_MELLP|nr:uncharacterized protein MELLADRAFT_105651 [Melampsora larici-populina 98AG31]EGG07638.1 hypothetical protein MELLADRAFT_105651 [Melampsora larici-populina 98AG31]